MGIFKVKVRLIGYDKDGREIGRREKESDLILNNFGAWFAGLIRTPQTGVATVTMKSTGGADQTIRTYGNYPGAVCDWYNTNLNTQIGVGSSSQAPARTDFNLISQLGSLVATNAGSWSSPAGQITFLAQIVLAAGGTVREVALIAYWSVYLVGATLFMLFRDVVADLVISPGGSVLVEYILQC